MDHDSSSRWHQRVWATCNSPKAGAIFAALLATVSFSFTLLTRVHFTMYLGWGTKYPWNKEPTLHKILLGMSLTTIAVRAVEVPLVLVLFAGIIMGRPRLALPWMLWCPATLLVQTAQKMADVFEYLSRRDRYDLSVNPTDFVEYGFSWVYCVLVTMCCVVLVQRWRTSKASAHGANAASNFPMDTTFRSAYSSTLVEDVQPLAFWNGDEALDGRAC